MAVKEVARRVRIRAQAFKWDVLRASRIASLEKNPARKGVPARARLPIVRHDEVKGVRKCMPPILRMSCSSLRLWITEPEQRKSIALKKACVQIWRKARCGWFSPMATIMSPSWLDVEKATIFLMSFWVRAHVAVKSVVRAPKHKQMVKAVWLPSSSGLSRTKRKMPATTIVLECSRADTGVGPSMAEGSQGWSPNWADLPAAATIRPRRGKVRSKSLEATKICWISQEFNFVAIQAMAKMRPMSPIRLYTTAWRAAVFASARPPHQPIRRNDIMPTPSQPMNSWNMLLAVTRVSIAIRKISRYLKNRLMLGSECMYHEANSRMDHVTYKATVVKITEYWSNLKLRLISKHVVFIQVQDETIVSAPSLKNINNGRRLMKKESFTADVMLGTVWLKTELPWTKAESKAKDKTTRIMIMPE